MSQLKALPKAYWERQIKLRESTKKLKERLNGTNTRKES